MTTYDDYPARSRQESISFDDAPEHLAEVGDL